MEAKKEEKAEVQESQFLIIDDGYDNENEEEKTQIMPNKDKEKPEEQQISLFESFFNEIKEGVEEYNKTIIEKKKEEESPLGFEVLKGLEKSTKETKEVGWEVYE